MAFSHCGCLDSALAMANSSPCGRMAACQAVHYRSGVFFSQTGKAPRCTSVEAPKDDPQQGHSLHRDSTAPPRLSSCRAKHTISEESYERCGFVGDRLPPLDQRSEDIPDIIGHFLRKHGPDVGVDSPSIQPEAVEFLQKQRWPGNVRELENVIRQALLLARSYTISIDHVREVLRKSRKPLTSSEQNHTAYVSDLLTRAERGEVQNALAQMMTDLEPELYSQAIRRAQGNQAKAARWLGISRLRMREKLRQLGLHPASDPGPDDIPNPQALRSPI
jgi:DNA-binding protein Fis